MEEPKEVRNEILESLVRFLTGTSMYTGEMQAFFMALQGAMVIRNGPNKDKHMHWFHSFALSSVAGYAGGLLGFMFMGKPSAFLSNDLCFAACVLSWLLVNCTPGDVGYKLCNALPVVLITTSWAQIFRFAGMIRFIKACFNDFKGNPSKYYPIPVFGPILYGTFLGNMGGLVFKGLEGHVANGVPWPVQNGFFCGTFFHFYVHDTTGPIGTFLRAAIPASKFTNLDDEAFAMCLVSIFMQVTGILQLPAFLGPSFTPFGPPILSPWKDPSTWKLSKEKTVYQQSKMKSKDDEKDGDDAVIVNGQGQKVGKRKKNKKGKKKQS